MILLITKARLAYLRMAADIGNVNDADTHLKNKTDRQFMMIGINHITPK